MFKIFKIVSISLVIAILFSGCQKDIIKEIAKNTKDESYSRVKLLQSNNDYFDIKTIVEKIQPDLLSKIESFKLLEHNDYDFNGNKIDKFSYFQKINDELKISDLDLYGFDRVDNSFVHLLFLEKDNFDNLIEQIDLSRSSDRPTKFNIYKKVLISEDKFKIDNKVFSYITKVFIVEPGTFEPLV